MISNKYARHYIYLDPSIIFYHHYEYSIKAILKLFAKSLSLKKTGAFSAHSSDIGVWNEWAESKINYVWIGYYVRIRLSDGNNFFDATLIGPYDVVGHKIVVSPFTAHHGTAM